MERIGFGGERGDFGICAKPYPVNFTWSIGNLELGDVHDPARRALAYRLPPVRGGRSNDLTGPFEVLSRIPNATVGESDRSFRYKCRDRGRTYVVSRVGDLLAVQNCEAANLFDDITDVNRGRSRAPLDDRATMRPQVVWRDPPSEAYSAIRGSSSRSKIDRRMAHVLCRHRGCGQPFFTEFVEALGFEEAALFQLLFDPRPFGVDAQLSRSSKRQPGRSILAEGDGLAPSVHAMFELKSESAGRPTEHIHAVPASPYNFSLLVSDT
jgi:hypothetical protein